MQVKLCILLAACVCAHPIQDKQNANKTSKTKKYISTLADVKALEKEIWKATSTGDLSRAIKLENRLEADILKAAIIAVAQSRKNPERSKRELKELGAVVRRDKRTAKFISSALSAGAQTGLNLLLGNNKNEGAGIHNKTLIRIPRQGKGYNFRRSSTRRNDELSNEILPPASPTISPATTINPDSIDITTAEVYTSTPSYFTTTIATDSATADTNQEEVTPRGPASQEQEEDEDEGGGGLGGLITSFLGSLSTPEGGVDLDAVTGLLGGISTQNDDGTFDFTGLQDTVGSLFGGTEEGGSNVGMFLGGLIGAVIRGSAGDEGARGAGRLAGNLLSAILPGLSAFPTPEDENARPQEGLDSGGFLTGFLSTVIGGLGGLSNSNSSGGGGYGGSKPGSGGALVQIKFQIVKGLFQVLSKILGASSTSKQTPQYGTTYYGPPPQQ